MDYSQFFNMIPECVLMLGLVVVFLFDVFGKNSDGKLCITQYLVACMSPPLL